MVGHVFAMRSEVCATRKPIDVVLSNEERELIELLRGNRARAFTLKIELKTNYWYVAIRNPNLLRPPTDGDGVSFSEAWSDLHPFWSA
jgi:hypothetical protein